MHARSRYLTLGSALALLSGCAAITPAPQGKLFEREGVSLVVVPAGSRETYFSDNSSTERHCRAPSPDFSVTASEGFSVSAARAGVSEDASKGALSFGGRDPAVLISRELMYRTCEISSNLNLPTAESLKLFRDVLNVIVKISKAQTGAGDAASSAAPADARTQAPAPTSSGASGIGSTTDPTSTGSSTSSPSGSSSW